ncbi:hypothetical protein RDWZM_000694 [Blomia tropicalis]|uniref:Protein BCCIP homolog n=1 Tax=Blomia tropicalis TaxID=40697 RepID=A0A9Q0MAQ6_BLOTA|nr:hypothetical protein RDWZM_000694 [Blomia tropicalis]
MSNQNNKRKTALESIDSEDLKKKRENEEIDEAVDDEEDDNDDGYEYEDEDGGSDQEFINKEVQIDFTAYGADESDYHGIKCLLQRLWLKEKVDLDDLAKTIIEDNTVAIVLKQENENDEKEDSKKEEDDNENDDQDNVYGVISLIPFNEYFNGNNCVKQIKKVLCERMEKDHPIRSKLEDKDSVCALVINERFINISSKISLPCYQQLIEDVKQFKPVDDLDTNYHFDSIIMICKILKPKNDKIGETIYINAEDEIFDEVANERFQYSVSDQCDSDVFDWNDDENLYEPFRKVLLLSSEKWIQTIQKLKNVV